MRDLGDGVLPVMLGGAAHHQQVAGLERDRPTLAAALWAHAEDSRSAEAHDRHERVDLGPADPVGMPRDAVGAGLVVVAVKPLEAHVVVL